jgi:hypothetical protein
MSTLIEARSRKTRAIGGECAIDAEFLFVDDFSTLLFSATLRYGGIEGGIGCAKCDGLEAGTGGVRAVSAHTASSVSRAPAVAAAVRRRSSSKLGDRHRH